MYCSACGIPLAAGLSFCNRCGTSLNRTSSTQAGALVAFLTAITVIAVAGLGIMLGGSLVLTKEAGLPEPVVSAYMAMVFLLVLIVEIFLCRQLSRVLSKSESPPPVLLQSQVNNTGEIRPADRRVLPEPLPSVTENTTRTLEYSRKEPLTR
jgi:hypothetical protein